MIFMMVKLNLSLNLQIMEENSIKKEPHAITDVDTKNNTFTFSDNGKDYVVTYELKDDDSMDYDMGNYLTGSNKDTAYKEGSEAYKKEMK